MSRRISPEAILNEYEALGFPSADKLHKSLKNKGFQISYKDILSFTKAQPVRQVFAPSPWTKRNAGNIVSLDLNHRWFADLIDQTQNPSGGYKHILIVQDVFSRKIYARALETKTPVEVAEQLKSIFEEAGAKPQTFETDGGAEFTGAVRQLLARESIVPRTKLPIQANVHATIDRAISSLRQTLSRHEVEKGTPWHEALTRAVAAYNNTPHAALGPAAPNDVQESDVLQHVMRREAAQKSAENSEKAEELQDKFKAAGNFRMRTTPFRTRGFKERWGEAKKVAATKPGVLVDEEGREYPLRQATAVEVAGPDVVVPEGLRGGKQIPEKYRDDLVKWVRETNPQTLPAINDYLRGRGLRGVEARAEQLKKLGIQYRRNQGYFVEEEEDLEETFREWIAKTEPSSIGKIEAYRKSKNMKPVKVSEAALANLGVVKRAGRYVLGSDAAAPASGSRGSGDPAPG
jgi:hypothetical protein